MAFFSFEKRLQLLLIMGALAAAPGCYNSSSGSDDVTGDDPVTDQRQDDPVVDPGQDDPSMDRVDVVYDADVVQDLADEEFVVDPVPWPMCTEVVASSLTVFQTAGRFPTTADGTVTLNLPYYYELFCDAPAPCISAVVRGSGAITQLEQLGPTSAMFRYENGAMAFGETVPIDFTWRVTCMGSSGMQMEETVAATAYACRDEMMGTLKIVNTSDECIPMVDPPPPPTAMTDGGPKIAGTALDGGKIMLTLPAEMRKAQKVVWEASAGSLQVLSPDKAVFTPAGGRRIQVVQAAIVTPRGVIIELYRHKA